MSQNDNQIHNQEVRDEMEDTELDSGAIKPPMETGQSSYTAIAYPANALPDQYRNMVYSKWMRQLRFGNEYFKLIDSQAYYEIYHKLIDVYLSRPNAVLRLAVLTDEPDT